MCLHVTRDMLMLLLIFSVLTLLTVSHYGRWIWIQSSFPQNTCHHQNHISHHFYASNIVLHFVRSILSVYTHMVMKIFTVSCLVLWLVLLFFPCTTICFLWSYWYFYAFLICLVFYVVITDLYQKFYPNYLKFLWIVPIYQVFQQFTLLGNMSLEAAVIWIDCSPGWYTVMILEFTFPHLWNSHHLPCELLNQLLDCSLSIAVERSKAFWLLIPKRWLIFHFIFWNFVMMSLGAGFALIQLGL